MITVSQPDTVAVTIYQTGENKLVCVSCAIPNDTVLMEHNGNEFYLGEACVRCGEVLQSLTQAKLDPPVAPDSTLWKLNRPPVEAEPRRASQQLDGDYGKALDILTRLDPEDLVNIVIKTLIDRDDVQHIGSASDAKEAGPMMRIDTGQFFIPELTYHHHTTPRRSVTIAMHVREV